MTTTESGTQLDELCINTIRTLSMDAVQKANSGHPGAPMALAPLAYVLYTRVMRHNPANPDCWVAEGTLHLKGVVLRAKDASPDLARSVSLCADELAVQVKRHRDKRRARRATRAARLRGDSEQAA